jgi:hypothetical protein
MPPATGTPALGETADTAGEGTPALGPSAYWQEL